MSADIAVSGAKYVNKASVLKNYIQYYMYSMQDWI
jgi:hypothetical protein